MNWNRLYGEQYVRLAPGAAEKIGPYLGLPPAMIAELVLTLPAWPETLQPAPRRGHNGRLIAGDPVLLDACDLGLILAGAPDDHDPVLVRWGEIVALQVLRQTIGG